MTIPSIPNTYSDGSEKLENLVNTTVCVFVEIRNNSIV